MSDEIPEAWLQAGNRATAGPSAMECVLSIIRAVAPLIRAAALEEAMATVRETCPQTHTNIGTCFGCEATIHALAEKKP